MASSNARSVTVLNDLSRLCKDSEKGFKVAAQSVDNRGLKMLFKTYAQQRAQFAAELAQEVERLGSKAAGSSIFLAVLHRGWIDIRAAMTLGPQNTENFVLSEALRGEGVALQRYERALKQELPAAIQTVVERQRGRIVEVREQLQRMCAQSPIRLVVRLFDGPEDVDRAVASLQAVGFEGSAIKTVALDQMVAVYKDEGKSTAAMESGITGAVLGAGGGSVIGLIAGISVLLTPGSAFMELPGFASGAVLDSVGSLVLWVIIGALAGALFGALIGSLIGRGVAEGDAFLYDDSVRHGHTLLMVQSENKRAAEAASIMHQVNASRMHGWHDRPEAQQGSVA